MTDTHTNPTPEQSASDKSLIGELQVLGTQLEAVVRAFLASDKAHQIQQELQNGVNEVAQRIQTIAQSEQVSEVSEKGKQMVEKAFENPKVAQAHEQVVAGISTLNDELRKIAASLAESSAPTTPPSDKSGPQE
jgi:uncharacterized phage infection (PIP) family protein YhgE